MHKFDQNINIINIISILKTFYFIFFFYKLLASNKIFLTQNILYISSRGTFGIILF
jgi:hypothetical protein